MNTFVLFGCHFIPYWVMVYLYDSGETRDFKKAVYNSLSNQVTITLPTIYIVLKHYPMVNNGIIGSIACIPFMVITGDIYFYTLHRLMHTRYLWPYHKLHHSDSVSVSKSLDGSVLEHLLCNLGSFIIGFYILLQLNVIINMYVVCIWISFATINTCGSHSSGCAPYDSGVHRLHHLKLTRNYGTGFYIMDRLVGSYENVNS
jgi:sterol desaturase/sphingolipid hydroxylase (fatty acid hydroxylase superfamily)